MITPPATAPAPAAAKKTAATAKPVATPPAAASDEGGYSVQVAAYNVKSQAQAMVEKLKKSGYDARVSGTSAPFRVRIGHYPTQAQASAVMRSLKAKQINGFVVKAE
jgi:cell division protein FtsN